ncbi:MAG: putative DNA-binding protein [Anaerovorax sp.]
MQIDKIIKISMLFDFYGQLLTEKQREIFSLYHEDNFSLAEISKEVGMSRQGVHDAVKKAEIRLNQYEEKLGLVEKFSKKETAIERIDKGIDQLIKENKDSGSFVKQLKEIKKIIDGLND